MKATIIDAFQVGGINLVMAQNETGQPFLIGDLPRVSVGQLLYLVGERWTTEEPTPLYREEAIHDDLSEITSRG